MNIYQKIAEVMKDVEYLQKDDDVDAGKGRSYKAITEEKVTTAVRKSLIKHGVVIIPVEQKRERSDETVVDKYGNQRTNHLTEVDTVYRIQNIEDPEDCVFATSSGSGVDTQDKGVGKAMTYAYKYLLLRTFAIPTGEDPDKVSSEAYSGDFKPVETISKVQAKTLHDLAVNAGMDDNWLLQRCGVSRLGEITAQQYGVLATELSL